MIVTDPAATPVTKPEVELTLAILAFEEDQVPPDKLFVKDNVAPPPTVVAFPAALIEGIKPSTKLDVVPDKLNPENVPSYEFVELSVKEVTLLLFPFGIP